jgi:hypothetical protein
MTVKVGISLPDATHARALEHARSAGTTLSGLIDAALKAELTRRELADHMACSPRPTIPSVCMSGRGRAAVRCRRGRPDGDRPRPSYAASR